MTTLERKQCLKRKIDSTQDQAVLAEIEAIFMHPDELIRKFEEAHVQYLRGEFLADEEEKKEMVRKTGKVTGSAESMKDRKHLFPVGIKGAIL
ncbi:hypothetical protein [Chryseobacterium koreense]